MNCRGNREKISFLVDGELGAEDAAALESHIKSCPGCRAYFNRLKDLKESIGSMPRIAPSESFGKRLEARLRRPASGSFTLPVRTRTWFRQAVALAVAACILIAVVIVTSRMAIKNDTTTSKPENSNIAGTQDNNDNRIIVPKPDIIEPAPAKDEKEPVELPEDELELVKRPDIPPSPTPPIPEIPEMPEPPDLTRMAHKDNKSSVDEAPRLPEEKRGQDNLTTQREPEKVEEKLAPNERESAPMANIKNLEKDFYKSGKLGDTEHQIALLHNIAGSAGKDKYGFFKKILTQPARQVASAVRREALFVLAETGTKEAAGIMLFVYSDVDWHVSDAVPEALSRIEEKETLEWLAREALTSSRSSDARRMIAESLAHVKEPVSHELFAAALAKESDPKVRTAICFSLGYAGDVAAEDALLKAMSDNSWLVREAALRALSRVGTMKCVGAAIRSLGDSQTKVKEAAAAVLAENPDVRSVAPLVRLLVYDDIRLRGAVLTSLWRITGLRFTKQSEWRAWLKKAGPYPETDSAPDATPPAPASFLDIPLWSKSVIYLVDASGSMRGETKVKEAKQLVLDSILNLPEDTRFNIVFFSSSMRTFSHTTLPRADARIKLKARQWLEQVRLPEAGKTDFYHALSTVLRNRPDDLVVISDGVPTSGRFTYPSKLIREIADQNLQQKTRIHALGFYNLQPTEGPTPVPVGPSVDFLKDLAAKNNGEFRYRWFNAGSK